MSEIHFTNFYLHVLTTKDMAGNTATRTYTIKKKKFPEIGQYVKYTPDSASNYYVDSSLSGSDSAQTITSAYDPTTWRIMEVGQNGNITKLLGSPNNNQSIFTLGNVSGYNNGVYLLNDICAKRYKNSSLGATARHLNIDDLESQMNNAGLSARNSYKYDRISQYGTTKMYTGSKAKYPAIYAQEKYSGINISDVSNGSQIIAGNINSTAKSKMNPNGKTQSENVYTSPTYDKTAYTASYLTCTQTYYSFESPSSYFKNSNFYNMVFETGTNFWLASRCIKCSPYGDYASFGIYYILSNRLLSTGFFNYQGYGSGFVRLAPVVSLGSEIQVKNGSGTENDPYVIGK